ncbi:DUF1801 domain-containing protein [Paenibacillus albiflavus]|uniref:DUF1801 domain-containing protein n=1 Tax=Paenibacillus albiflavus TaxID=2545760 RepID=A0A4R4EG59_9BACL|nr:DUF1801 domain-containing protein [Paenibacillus albiflavus]TCZ77098.1 DUF1801 domain-containing protein [Paenibacillus albiflavus]
MNQEVTEFIEALEPWQSELSEILREVVYQAIPDALERMQYKKPHFLKNGKYAAVISPSKAAVSFTIFHTSELNLPAELFDGPPERKTMKLRNGDMINRTQLAEWISQASGSL